MATHPGPASGRRALSARWLILRPTQGLRSRRSVRAGRADGAPGEAGRVASAAILGVWTGSGVTTALLMPLALGAHIPTAFAAGLLGSLLPRALLGGVIFATTAFLLTLRGGGPSRTLAAVSALSAALGRMVLVPRAEHALATGSATSFVWLHFLSVLVFAVSVLSAAAGAAILVRPLRPGGRGPGTGAERR